MSTLELYTFAIRATLSTTQKLQKSMPLPTHENKERKTQ